MTQGNHQFILEERSDIAAGTKAFFFAKPEGFTFKAGQYVDLTLIDPQEMDNGGATRTFSIASAPHEERIMIATRMRDSAFKRILRTMPLGSAVRALGPAGSLTLHTKSDRPAVFIAGGIGITPFRSMIMDARNRDLPHRITLLYADRDTESAAFLEELRAATEGRETIAIVPHSGAVTEEVIAPLRRENAIYYITGSFGMVSAVREMLNALHIDDDDIRAEEFAGY